MSLRKCKFCYVSGTKVSNGVDVNPYYSYNIRSVSSHLNFSSAAYIDIEEKFICPSCGQLNINTYDLSLDQEDMRYFVNKKLEREDK
jgi:hypothetical protein